MVRQLLVGQQLVRLLMVRPFVVRLVMVWRHLGRPQLVWVVMVRVVMVRVVMVRPQLVRQQLELTATTTRPPDRRGALYRKPGRNLAISTAAHIDARARCCDRIRGAAIVVQCLVSDYPRTPGL